MERSTAEVLKAARKKIAKPEAWTKRFTARDKDNEPTSARAGNAMCWCAAGAVWAVTADPGRGDPGAALTVLDRAAGEDITRYNDRISTTHADVLAMFDKAIALAEQEQA